MMTDAMTSFSQENRALCLTGNEFTSARGAVDRRSYSPTIAPDQLAACTSPRLPNGAESGGWPSAPGRARGLRTRFLQRHRGFDSSPQEPDLGTRVTGRTTDLAAS